MPTWHTCEFPKGITLRVTIRENRMKFPLRICDDGKSGMPVLRPDVERDVLCAREVTGRSSRQTPGLGPLAKQQHRPDRWRPSERGHSCPSASRSADTPARLFPGARKLLSAFVARNANTTPFLAPGVQTGCGFSNPQMEFGRFRKAEAGLGDQSAGNSAHSKTALSARLTHGVSAVTCL